MPQISAETLDLLVRSGINLLAMLILVGILYRPRHNVAGMPLVLASLNAGLFGALAVISAGEFAAGIGFGLFGLLSMLRLRSAAFTIKDVAYTFLVLILALVNGLADRPIEMYVIVNILLLVVVAVTDTSRGNAPSRVMKLTLEHAYTDPVEARKALEVRLAVEIRSVVIDEIDFVRETTEVTVVYANRDRGPSADDVIPSDGGVVNA